LVSTARSQGDPERRIKNSSGLEGEDFVPPTPIQDLHDLTRYRAELQQRQNRVANRIQKLLEQANLKLSSVASNAFFGGGFPDITVFWLC
jgi:hypothetical protein